MVSEITGRKVEDVEEFGKDSRGVAHRWLTEISLAQKEYMQWTKNGKRITKVYRNERPNRDQDTHIAPNLPRFNIFWSNVQTIAPAIYSATPKPEVMRRFKDEDVVAKVAAETLERALEYSLDVYGFDGLMREAVEDMLIVGRGQAWVRYIPHVEDVTPPPVRVNRLYQVGDDVNEGDYELVFDDGSIFEGKEKDLQEFDGELLFQDEAFEEVVFEEVVCDYVHWQDFLHNPARDWEEVRWVARRVFMTRDELRARFGEVGGQVDLDQVPAFLKDEDKFQTENEQFKKATVWEIWDEDSKKVYWISPGLKSRPLDVQDDFLGLKDFFPCPKPLYATTTTDTLVPVPDFLQYEAQARELDSLTARIAILTEALRVTGVYDASLQGIDRLLSSGVENRLIPVPNWPQFAGAGGFTGAVQFFPMREVAQVVADLQQLRSQVKNDIFEITGISDIVRGQGDARETATASGIKSKFATLRLSDRQKEIQRFARDIIQLKGEVISEHFSEDTLRLIASPESPEAQNPEVFAASVELLRDDTLRTFRIDIETDSTIAANEAQEKQERIEFFNVMAQFIQQSSQLAEAAPAFVPVLGQMMKLGMRGFKAGRNLEESVDQAIQRFEQESAQPQSGDSAQNAQAQAKSQAEAQKAQLRFQTDQQRLQLEAQKAAAQLALEKEKNDGKLAVEQAKNEGDLALEQAKTVGELRIKASKANADAALAQQKAFIQQLQ